MTSARITVISLQVHSFDWAYVNKAHGGGVLTAITTSLGSCSHRYDLGLCSECVWVEIPTADGISMLIGNHYFSPETELEVITAYFHQLKNILDTNILASFYWGTSMLLVLTMILRHPYLNVTIILSSKGMLYTPPHVFLAEGSALRLLTVLTCLT
jgi:hypothetical protein